MLKIALILCLVGIASAQVSRIGACPVVQTIPTFDVQSYTGVWYEQNRFFTIFEIGAKCVTANYTLADNGTVKVVNSQISSITGNPGSIEGVARIINPQDPGKLAVKFPVSPVDGSYWILGTDYTSYAAVWSCQDFYLFNTQFAWILTREQFPPDSLINEVKNIFEQNGINSRSFETTDQVECPARTNEL